MKAYDASIFFYWQTKRLTKTKNEVSSLKARCGKLNKYCNKCEKEFRAHVDEYQCPRCNSYETEDLEEQGHFVKKRDFNDEKEN